MVCFKDKCKLYIVLQNVFNILVSNWPIKDAYYYNYAYRMHFSLNSKYDYILQTLQWLF